MAEMLDIQHHLLCNAYRDTFIEAQAHFDKFHDDKAHAEFSVGDFVLLYPPAGRASKLDMTWLGPMRVVERVGDKYILQSLVDTSRLERHVSTLKPFLYPDSISPATIAARDRREFLVESILDHDPPNPTRNNGKFKVRWAGYDESSDTWEPLENLLDNEFFHDYCYDNNMMHLIPRAKRTETLSRHQNDINLREPRSIPTHVLRS
jgi:hypothetical protein